MTRLSSLKQAMQLHLRLGLSLPLLVCDAIFISVFIIDIVLFIRRGFDISLPVLMRASLDTSHIIPDSFTAIAVLLVLPLIVSVIVIVFSREWMPRVHLSAKMAGIIHYAIALPLLVLCSTVVIGLRRTAGIQLKGLQADPAPAFSPLLEQVNHFWQNAIPWLARSLFKPEAIVSLLIFALAVWFGYRSYPDFVSDYINAGRMADIDSRLLPSAGGSRQAVSKSLLAPVLPCIERKVRRVLFLAQRVTEDTHIEKLCLNEVDVARRALAKAMAVSDDQITCRFYPDQFTALRENLDHTEICNCCLIFLDVLDTNLKECIRRYSKSQWKEVVTPASEIGSHEWLLQVAEAASNAAKEFGGSLLVFVPGLIRPINTVFDIRFFSDNLHRDGVTIRMVPDLTGLSVGTLQEVLPLCDNALIGSSLALLTSEPCGIWWGKSAQRERHSKWSITATSAPSNLRSVVGFRLALNLGIEHSEEFSRRSDVLSNRFRSNLGAGFVVLNNFRPKESRFYLTVWPEKGWKEESESVLMSDRFRGNLWDAPDGRRCITLQFPHYLDYWSMSRKAHAMRELALGYFAKPKD